MPDLVTCALELREVSSGYGKKQILNSVSLTVADGEIVALIGHNGAGKTTLLKAVIGLVPVWKGQLYVRGKAIGAPNPRLLLRESVAYLPQGNRVFGDLTVKENLELGSYSTWKTREGGGEIDRALSWFPALSNLLTRRAGILSGGEKQMLALGTALMTSPRILLLDEPSLGLAPPLVVAALRRIKAINQREAITFVIVEQKVREVLNIANRVYVLRNGCISFAGASAELKEQSRLREVYF